MLDVNNDLLTVTCKPGHRFSSGVTVQMVRCLQDGLWPSISACDRESLIVISWVLSAECSAADQYLCSVWHRVSNGWNIMRVWHALRKSCQWCLETSQYYNAIDISVECLRIVSHYTRHVQYIFSYLLELIINDCIVKHWVPYCHTDTRTAITFLLT